MTDDFTLRWEIDNPSVTLATGRAESEVFDERGFKWIAVAEKHTDGWTTLTLRCGADDAREWKCEADVAVYVLQTHGSHNCCRKGRHCFNAYTPLWSRLGILDWDSMKEGNWTVNNKITIEFRVCIISAERKPIVDPSLFSTPNRRSDVILKIGVQKLHVSKELLAIHSPVFETLFFGEFAEKGKEEVELKDVVYEEFIDLLQLIYVENGKITDRTVQHILKLADQFQVKCALNLSVEHLKQTKTIDALKKLLLVDQYNLTSLKDHCLQSFANDPNRLRKLEAFSEADKFSDGMKLEIFNRLVKEQ